MNLRIPFQHVVAATIVVVVTACAPDTPPNAPVAALPAEHFVAAGGEQLRGVMLDAATGLSVFRGIPYAAPPVGSLRWRPPAAHVPRAGVQDASEFAPACPQNQGNHDWYRKVAVLFGNPPETIGPLEDIDEDCLYLNVWTRNLGGADKQPVMVWIYGGSNMNGYAHEPNYQGHGLAQRGVVFVSLNYRVGALGFLAHAGLAAESKTGTAGNYGILDQLAALHWIRQNIAQFGGDPDNVTIFGESAGGANAGTLIASPLAEGLFHRAIIQSGGYNMDSLMTQRDAEEIGAKIAAQLGFENPLSDVEIIDGMRELGWQQIVDGAAAAKAGWYASAVIDGHVLPDATARIFSDGKLNDVDLLIGSNANENYMYQDDASSRQGVSAELAEYGDPYADELRKLLADDLQRNFRLAQDRMSGASTFLCTSRYMARALAQRGNNVYFYHFTRVRPGGDRILAYHGAEIPYALDTADDWLPADASDAALTKTMAQYWVNFATRGSPNGTDLPNWPAFTVENGEYQELGDSVSAGRALETGICDVLDRRRQSRLAAMN